MTPTRDVESASTSRILADRLPRSARTRSSAASAANRTPVVQAPAKSASIFRSFTMKEWARHPRGIVMQLMAKALHPARMTSISSSRAIHTDFRRTKTATQSGAWFMTLREKAQILRKHIDVARRHGYGSRIADDMATPGCRAVAGREPGELPRGGVDTAAPVWSDAPRY